MTQFVNNDVSSGAVVYASDHNTQGSLIASVLNGNIDATNIADNSVTSGKIADNAVTAGKLDSEATAHGFLELKRTTLSVAGDTISVTGIPEKKYLRVICWAIPTGGNIDGAVRFNNDSGSNYTRRGSLNGGSDGVGTSLTSTGFGDVASQPYLLTLDIVNVTNQEKLVQGHVVFGSSAGAGTAATRLETVGKWANTSSQITRVDLVNTSTGDFAIGSEVIVEGKD